MRFLSLSLLLLTFGMAPSGFAHQESVAYLNLSADAEQLAGHIDLSVDDLGYALDLDASRDGADTLGNLRDSSSQIEIWLDGGLAFEANKGACAFVAGEFALETRQGESYLAVPFTVTCPGSEIPASLHYDLMFDVDRQHSVIVSIEQEGTASQVVLSSDSRVLDLGSTTPLLGTFLGFGIEGFWHILGGLDHLVFLATLLLPSTLIRVNGVWQPAARFRQALGSIVLIVTAFTVAHSITLAMAATGVAAIPPAIVEPVIAISILLGAVNNIWPVITRRIWLFAFGFGLIHGFGFAGALGEALRGDNPIVPALLGFNLGVEAGQMLLVLALLPALYLLRTWISYRRWLMPTTSALAGIVAAVWVVQRIGIPAVA